MTTYSHISFGTLKSQLAARMGDPSKTHWLDDETGRVLIETLQTHNVLTGFHRDTLTFDTTPGVAFYDLPFIFPSVIGYTLTDQTIIALIEYALMERINLTAWSGTEKWTFDSVVRSLERRRNQFLTETQSVTVQRTLSSDTTGYVDLPDTVVAITRAVWISGSTGVHHQLWPSDEMMFEGVLPSWLQSPGIPSSFSSSAAIMNLRMQLFPPPAESGFVELLTVESAAVLDPTALPSGTALGIPNDLAWGPRFGAMADLLRNDGPARDTARADICDQLYDLAVDLGRSLPLVLTAAINGVRLPVTSLTMIDGASPGWESRNRGKPTRIAIAGGNLLAVAPVPDNVYSVTLQVVRNAVTPASPADNAMLVQISRDDLDAILAWGELLLAFKSQGTQLESARIGSKLLLDRAAAYNERRVLGSTYLAQILERSSEEKTQRPIFHDTDRSRNRGGDQGQGQHQGASTGEFDRGDSASSRQSRQRSIMAKRRRTLGGR